MALHRKLLVIMWLLATLAIACGPRKNKGESTPKEPTPAEPAEADDGETNLEADCFAGDQGACDQLGH